MSIPCEQGYSGEVERVHRRFLVVMALSLLMVVGAMAWTYHIGLKSNAIEHQLAHLEDGLKDLRQVVHQQEAKVR